MNLGEAKKPHCRKVTNQFPTQQLYPPWNFLNFLQTADCHPENYLSHRPTSPLFRKWDWWHTWGVLMQWERKQLKCWEKHQQNSHWQALQEAASKTWHIRWRSTSSWLLVLMPGRRICSKSVSCIWWRCGLLEHDKFLDPPYFLWKDVIVNFIKQAAGKKIKLLFAELLIKL